MPAVKDDCQRDCKAAREAKPETPSPLPLSVVTRAEEVADWHADIFERLSSQQGDDRSARYCGLGSRSAHRQL